METAYVELDTVHNGAVLAVREAQEAINNLLNGTSVLHSIVSQRDKDDVLDLDTDVSVHTPDTDEASIRVFHPTQKTESPFVTAWTALKSTSVDAARVSATAAGIGARLTLGGLLALDKKCGDLITEAGSRLQTLMSASSYDLAPALASIPIATQVSAMPVSGAYEYEERVQRIPVVRYHAPVTLAAPSVGPALAEPFRLPIQGRHISREVTHQVRVATMAPSVVEERRFAEAVQTEVMQVSTEVNTTSGTTIRVYALALGIVAKRILRGTR